MRFTDSTQQSDAFSSSAMEMMAQHGIGANPQNFAVWYGYFSGRDPDLNRTLDILLSNKADFTEERNWEIYEKFFGSDGAAGEIQLTGQRVEAEVAAILDSLTQAERDQSAYGAKLEGFSGQLDGQQRAEDLRRLVGGILSETRGIMVRNQALEGRLGESAREIEDLREHLVEVQREASTDALTGIANRKSFDSSLRDEARNAMEAGTDLCLLLTDVDHFKKFNDTFGHRVGDEVLKVVARALKDGVKGRDTAARYGGEEFAVILPLTSIEDAVTVAEQIRATLASRKLQNRRSGDEYGTVTLSIGVARYRYGESLDDLVQRADQALYLAKRNGRNRVVDDAALDTGVELAV